MAVERVQNQAEAISVGQLSFENCSKLDVPRLPCLANLHNLVVATDSTDTSEINQFFGAMG